MIITFFDILVIMPKKRLLNNRFFYKTSFLSLKNKGVFLT